jgi:hypothetical protein
VRIANRTASPRGAREVFRKLAMARQSSRSDGSTP